MEDPLDDLVADLAQAARALLGDRRRVLLGLCGAPGSGKSTTAAALVAALGPEAVVVPMDGFHLHDDELRRLGRHDRKGAPDTFDVEGYVALLARLRDPSRIVYAPVFDRDAEVALAGALAVQPEHRLVITEGNYLLLPTSGWAEVRPHLDACWFLTGNDDVRRSRLVARHVRHGRTPEEARAWVDRSDEANAALVATTGPYADRVVTLG